ncbi:hypothetical protein [Streptococcus pseudopneumoniae]|uniref:hypothetical protein n=1 Tax=Streptococcus pseudopneumoniae TaxID=257758 RepID=UPI00110C2BE7|nr:hypothetical protein [Streptococcus pseudopneumoniae]TMR44274.1 hypothetical protein E3V85_09220 [Streptococcus pseudopneumoniae]
MNDRYLVMTRLRSSMNDRYLVMTRLRYLVMTRLLMTLLPSINREKDDKKERTKFVLSES